VAKPARADHDISRLGASIPQLCGFQASEAVGKIGEDFCGHFAAYAVRTQNAGYGDAARLR
jgi:hypothetical protein